MYDVRQGYYWHARLPSGKWAVFWYHPANDDLHREIATFASEARALRYVNDETEFLNAGAITAEDGDDGAITAAFPAPSALGEASEPALHVNTNVKPWAEPPGFVAPPRKSKLEGGMSGEEFDLVKQRIIADLPILFATHPHGVSTRVVQREYGMPYDKVCRVMNAIDAIGAARYVYAYTLGADSEKAAGSARGKVLVPIDAAVKETDLTEGQERVVKAMCARADRHNLCTMSIDEIADAAAVQFGSVAYMVGALERKGYIMLSKPGSTNGPAIYQVLDKAVSLGS